MTFLYFASKKRPGSVYVDRPAGAETARYGAVRAAIDLDLVLTEKVMRVGVAAAEELRALIDGRAR